MDSALKSPVSPKSPTSPRSPVSPKGKVLEPVLTLREATQNADKISSLVVTNVFSPFTEIDWNKDSRTPTMIKGAPLRITKADHKSDQRVARRYCSPLPLRVIVYYKLDGRKDQQTYWYSGNVVDNKYYEFKVDVADPKMGHADNLKSILASRTINVVIDIPPQVVAQNTPAPEQVDQEENQSKGKAKAEGSSRKRRVRIQTPPPSDKGKGKAKEI